MTTLGVIFPPDQPPERLRAVVEAAEESGLEELWLWEDCFQVSGIASMSAALAWSERLRVGVGLLPVPMRNVALTAMEASLRATLRFTVVPRSVALEQYGAVTGPLVVTPDHLVPTGLAEDLDEAVQHCVRAAIELLHARFGMDRPNALAYLSAAVDFDISQVVDLVKGVHARIPLADFDA